MLTQISDFLFVKAYAADINFFDLGFKFQDAKKGTKPEDLFTNILNNVLTWVLVIIFLVAFIYLIMSGVKYITSGGDAAKATEARNGVLNAIIGIVIVLLAYVILRFAGGLAGNINS
jgi:hypothetical protein